MRIVVAGAGLSGLSLCQALKERLASAGKSADVILIESEDRVGGKIRTHKEKGYVMEWGPNGFLNNKPDTLELCRKIGVDGLLLPSNDAARRRFIYANGRLNEISGPGMVLGGLVSWPGKFRILKEYVIPKRTDPTDETLADFTRRRLGPEALEKLIGPMASGVYGGDPERMSLKSCFPVIYNLEQTYGGLIRGMLGKMKDAKRDKKTPAAGPAGPGGVLTSFSGGLEVLTDSLRSAFKGEVVLASPVRSVTRTDAGFTVRHGEGGGPIEADIFITASPSYAASGFLRDLDPAISGVLDKIPYVPMAVAALGYKQEEVGRTLDGFGFLVGMKEGRKILGCLWDSSAFKGRAPEGCASLRLMAGGGRDFDTPALPDESLTALIKDELKITMGVTGTPEIVKIFRHEKAIPMYTVGHSERVAALDRMEAKHKGLLFAGNAYRGVALNDCVREAYAVADKAMTLI